MSGRVGVEQTPDNEALVAALREFIVQEVGADLPGMTAQAKRGADALAPVLAAAVREARAAELREAADEIDAGGGWMGPQDVMRRLVSSLRDRADRIDVDAPEGGEGR